MDKHQDSAQAAIWQDGEVRQARSFATTPQEAGRSPAASPQRNEVALEAGKTWAIAALLASQAGRMAVSNPAKIRDVCTGSASPALPERRPVRVAEK